MPPKCEKRLPTFRINMHMPATSWHPHRDKTFEVKRDTEWEAWAYTMRDILQELTQGNLRLMVGFWGDALNVLPPEARTALLTVIAKGYGLQIKTAADAPDTIEIGLVQRYQPLVGEKKTPAGLVVPPEGKSGLVLPGDPQYTVKGR